MQITDFELFAVPPRWLLLKLETDEGIVGWGEPSFRAGWRQSVPLLPSLSRRISLGPTHFEPSITGGSSIRAGTSAAGRYS